MKKLLLIACLGFAVIVDASEPLSWNPFKRNRQLAERSLPSVPAKMSHLERAQMEASERGPLYPLPIQERAYEPRAIATAATPSGLTLRQRLAGFGRGIKEKAKEYLTQEVPEGYTPLIPEEGYETLTPQWLKEREAIAAVRPRPTLTERLDTLRERLARFGRGISAPELTEEGYAMGLKEPEQIAEAPRVLSASDLAALQATYEDAYQEAAKAGVLAKSGLTKTQRAWAGTKWAGAWALYSLDIATGIPVTVIDFIGRAFYSPISKYRTGSWGEFGFTRGRAPFFGAYGMGRGLYNRLAVYLLKPNPTAMDKKMAGQIGQELVVTAVKEMAQNDPAGAKQIADQVIAANDGYIAEWFMPAYESLTGAGASLMSGAKAWIPGTEANAAARGAVKQELARLAAIEQERYPELVARRNMYKNDLEATTQNRRDAERLERDLEFSGAPYSGEERVQVREKIASIEELERLLAARANEAEHNLRRAQGLPLTWGEHIGEGYAKLPSVSRSSWPEKPTIPTWRPWKAKLAEE